MSAGQVENAVAKTARDALHAKLSAVSTGHSPVAFHGDVYEYLLRCTNMAISSLSPPYERSQKTSSQVASSKIKAEVEPSHREVQNRRSFVRRQAPLINAGYAIRVSIVSDIIERFIKLHARDSVDQGIKSYVSAVGDKAAHKHGGDRGAIFSNFSSFNEPQVHCRGRSINVLLLGGGLDVIGIWALCAAAAITDGSIPVHLYEIDCAENLAAKQNAFVRTGIWIDAGECNLCGTGNTTVRSQTEGRFMAHGFIDPKSIFKSAQDETSPLRNPMMGQPEHHGADGECTCPRKLCDMNISLVEANLLDRNAVQSALAEVGIDTELPTMTVSEVTLAYLGVDGSNELMRLVASTLTTPGSLILAFEPMGGKTENCSAAGISTVTFNEDYCSRLVERLKRGCISSSAVGAGRQPNSLFSPLGQNCSSVRRRLRNCGFVFPGAFSAGNAARHLKKWRAISKEMFDEHAALALHLRCYVIACAFSPRTDVRVAMEMCLFDPIQELIENSSIPVWDRPDTELMISPLLRVNEESVRNLYMKVYSPMFSDYPAIKRMCKGALKNDLSGDFRALSETSLSNLLSFDECEASPVRERFKAYAGDFWVATMNSTSNHIKDGKSTEKVVGCVGVRLCRDKENVSRGSHSTVFEINRLIVDQDYRHMGIGKALLKKVETFVIENTPLCGPVLIVATTPAVMHAANQFYSREGFTLAGTKSLGEMVMKTYVKKTRHTGLRFSFDSGRNVERKCFS